jgi:hypothetical protein
MGCEREVLILCTSGLLMSASSSDSILFGDLAICLILDNFEREEKHEHRNDTVAIQNGSTTSIAKCRRKKFVWCIGMFSCIKPYRVA